MIVFIDDILVYSKIDEEHEDHNRSVLTSLKTNRLYAKFSKCEFWLARDLPEHVVSSCGVSINLAKIEVVTK